MSPRKQAARRSPEVDRILGPEDASLLDIVDNLLNKGVVLTGDVTLALANVDLVYLRLSLLLSAADRVLPGERAEFMERHHERRLLRARSGGGKDTGAAKRSARRGSRA